MNKAISRLIPLRLKNAAKARRRYRISHGVRAIANGREMATRKMLQTLNLRCGNDGFAANAGCLQEAAKNAAITEGPWSGVQILPPRVIAQPYTNKTHAAEKLEDPIRVIESPESMNWTILHTYPDPELEKHWREFLARADFPAHYVSPEYFRDPFFREKEPFAILAWHEGKIVGALTGLHEAQQVICGQASRPQVCFDRSIDATIAVDGLTAGLLAEAHSAALITLYTWSPVDRFHAHAYRVEREQGVVMIDLTKGPESLFKSFSSNRRTNVRAAIKRGVKVATATTNEEFWIYYEIYLEWCSRKNLVAPPFEAFEEAFALTNNRRLFLARFDGKVIAGVVIRLYPKGMIEYAANCSIKENLNLKPNDLLHWRVMQWACQEGYSSYSLGGAHLFLRKMGGTIVPVYRYRLDQTWFRRHELKEALQNSGRKIFHMLPKDVQKQVKRVWRRNK